MTPPDILHKATEAMRKIDTHLERDPIDIIAEAIAEERERCISLVNEYMAKRHSKGDEADGLRNE